MTTPNSTPQPPATLSQHTTETEVKSCPMPATVSTVEQPTCIAQSTGSNAERPSDPGVSATHIPQCPICYYIGKPEKKEEWNGIRGPGARLISREFSCPQCGVKFAHDAAWLEPLIYEPKH